MIRLLSLALLGASLAVSPLTAREKKTVPEDVMAERDRYRDRIEVGGAMYPVYLYEEEAKPKKHAKVVIPRQARQQGRGGTVLIGTIISRTGTVKEMTIAMTNAEPDIQEAALKAVGRWTFPPKRGSDGSPIEYVVMVPVVADATPFFGPQ